MIFLAFYRWAWEPALLFIRLCAGLEKLAGGKLWPLRWQLRKRLSDPATHESTNHLPLVWMHAASLGECKGLGATAEALTVDGGALSFILTANTVEGYEFLASQLKMQGPASQTRLPRWQVALAPLDHPREVHRFLRRHNVVALALFEVELWPHFILASRRASIPVFWISARLTNRASLRYGYFPGVLPTLLRHITWTLAQTHTDATHILEAMGNPGSHVDLHPVETGADLRGLYYLGADTTSFPRGQSVLWESRAGIALVSLHEEDLSAIASAVAKFNRPEVPLFVFPRQLESLPKFLDILEPLGFELRSRNPQATRQIFDAFGLVPQTLNRCRAAVIGGSFSRFSKRGGHNLWEPLAAGVHMGIGPDYKNQEYLATKLSAAGLLEIYPDAPDFESLYNKPDPGSTCRSFSETERVLLQESIRKIRTRFVTI